MSWESSYLQLWATARSTRSVTVKSLSKPAPECGLRRRVQCLVSVLLCPNVATALNVYSTRCAWPARAATTARRTVSPALSQPFRGVASEGTRTCDRRIRSPSRGVYPCSRLLTDALKQRENGHPLLPDVHRCSCGLLHCCCTPQGLAILPKAGCTAVAPLSRRRGILLPILPARASGAYGAHGSSSLHTA